MRRDKKLFLLFTFLISATSIFGQEKQRPDTTRPVQTKVNAGFDVIIKKNGDMVYGLVKEVGPVLISYQRTDIPDGPLYSLNRADVYAISYRNQVKDIINPLKDSIVHDTVVVHDAPVVSDSARQQLPVTPTNDTVTPVKRNAFMDRRNISAGDLRIGLGFLRSFSKVSHAGQYVSHLNFPVLSVAYDVRYNEQLRLGVQAAYGHHRFTGKQYSSYDSSQTSTDLNEYIFMLDAYARYNFSYHTAKLQPYIIGGIGLHNSHLNYRSDIDFVNDQNNAVEVRSGNNNLSIGLLGRIGVDYMIDRKTKAFADLGFGASVLNIGISLRMH